MCFFPPLMYSLLLYGPLIAFSQHAFNMQFSQLSKYCFLSLYRLRQHLYNQTNSVPFSPQAIYTDWATATCWRILVPTFVDRGVFLGLLLNLEDGGSTFLQNVSKHLPYHKVSATWILLAVYLSYSSISEMRRTFAWNMWTSTRLYNVTT
jgi:hypothetical protein